MITLAVTLSLAADTLPVQGSLSDTTGAPVSGPQAVTFALRGDGAPVWSSTAVVQFVDGEFATLLGGGGLDLAALGAYESLDLTVTLPDGASSAPVEVGWTPRAGFARRAGRADALGAHPAASYARFGATWDWAAVVWANLPPFTLPPLTPCGSGQVLTWNGSALACTAGFTPPPACAAGQVLTSNGTSLVCTSAQAAVGLGAACPAGQGLSWDGTTLGCVTPDPLITSLKAAAVVGNAGKALLVSGANAVTTGAVPSATQLSFLTGLDAAVDVTGNDLTVAGSVDANDFGRAWTAITTANGFTTSSNNGHPTNGIACKVVGNFAFLTYVSTTTTAIGPGIFLKVGDLPAACRPDRRHFQTGNVSDNSGYTHASSIVGIELNGEVRVWCTNATLCTGTGQKWIEGTMVYPLRTL
jgi:hypothetical protein